MMQGLLVIVEHKNGKLLKVSKELLSEAIRLGSQTNKTITALIIGYSLEPIVESVCHFDISRVSVVNNQLLSHYVREGYVFVIKELLEKYEPEVILFGNTNHGVELASSLAARLKKGLVTGCSHIEFSQQGELEVCKPVYGGKFSMDMRFATSPPQIVTVLPGCFEIEEKDKFLDIEIAHEEIAIPSSILKTNVEAVIKGDPKTVDLTEAEIIVAGGRGVGSKEGFRLIHELAGVLSGSVGASRVAVDKGWISSDRQIGQTGKTVSPELFMSFGISGAIQFRIGMQDSQFVVANNINRSAPIIKIADIALIGDLHEIIPALIEEIKRKKSDAYRLRSREEAS